MVVIAATTLTTPLHCGFLDFLGQQAESACSATSSTLDNLRSLGPSIANGTTQAMENVGQAANDHPGMTIALGASFCLHLFTLIHNRNKQKRLEEEIWNNSKIRSFLVEENKDARESLYRILNPEDDTYQNLPETTTDALLERVTHDLPFYRDKCTKTDLELARKESELQQAKEATKQASETTRRAQNEASVYHTDTSLLLEQIHTAVYGHGNKPSRTDPSVHRCFSFQDLQKLTDKGGALTLLTQLEETKIEQQQAAKRVSELGDQIDSNNKSIAESISGIKTLKTELDEANNERQQAITRASELEKQLEDLHKKHELLKKAEATKHRNLEAQVVDLEDRLKECANDLFKTKKDYLECLARSKSTREKTRKLTNLLEKRHSEDSAKKSKAAATVIAKLQMEREDALSTARELKDEAKTQNSQLLGEIETLKAKLQKQNKAVQEDALPNGRKPRGVFVYTEPKEEAPLPHDKTESSWRGYAGQTVCSWMQRFST